jgi:predicted negative regulator of RcsB-dependent stress response
MSTYDLEEQERIAELKDWWAKWGLWVQCAVGAVIVGMLAVQGWRYYQKNQAEEAEVLFKSVQKTAGEVAVSKEAKKLSDAATTLAEKYPRSFYATEAQLLAAKSAFDNKDLGAAKVHLQWVVDKGRDSHRNLARVRLAAVLLEDKKFDEALKVLDDVKEDAFLATAADLKGDIFAVQGRNDEARAAYQLAVDKSDARSPLKGVSEAKLDAVGGPIEKPKSDVKDAKGEGK